MTGVRDPQSINKFGDFAHVPGTGPKGFACRDCRCICHWYNAKKFGRCGMAATMRHTDVLNLQKIWLDSESCKYFEPRPEGEKPWANMVAANLEEPEADD